MEWKELIGLGVSVSVATAALVIGILWEVGDGLVDEARGHRQQVDQTLSEVLQETAYLRGLCGAYRR